MATKKRKEQLETLLDWEREGGRLPETVELFNRLVSPSLILREVDKRCWEVEAFCKNEQGELTRRDTIRISHTTLIQLALTILDGVKSAGDRYLKGKGNT